MQLRLFFSGAGAVCSLSLGSVLCTDLALVLVLANERVSIVFFILVLQPKLYAECFYITGSHDVGVTYLV